MGNEPTNAILLTAIAGAAVTVIGAVSTFIAQRKSAKRQDRVDIELSYSKIIEQLQEDVLTLRSDIKQYRQDYETLYDDHRSLKLQYEELKTESEKDKRKIKTLEDRLKKYEKS